MLAIVLRTKWVAAFSIRSTRLRPTQSTATRLLSSSSPEQPNRRPVQFGTFEEEVGLSGAYDYEPDIAEMEEMMRQEAQYNNNNNNQQQKPKVTTIQQPSAVITSESKLVTQNNVASKPPGRVSPPPRPAPRVSPVIRETPPSSQPSFTATRPEQPSASYPSTNRPVYDFFTYSNESQQRQESDGPPQRMSDDANTKNVLQPERPMTSPPQPIPIPNKPVDLLDFLHDLGAQMTLESNNNGNNNDANNYAPANNTFDTATTTTDAWESKIPVESPAWSAVTPSPTTTTPRISAVESPAWAAVTPPIFTTPRVTSSDDSPRPTSPFSRPRPPSPPTSTILGPEIRARAAQASSGIVTSSPVHILELELKQLTEQIYQENNNEPFNINSLHQVSTAVFGVPGESTNKEALEAKASTGNRMADLILQYRRVQQRIRKQSSKQQAVEQGTRVKSAVQSISSPTSSSSSSATTDTSAARTSSDPLLLVDASAYIYRAYYSMPPIHRHDGMPTGAVMGFCNMLNRLVMNRMIQGEQPRIVLVFDAKGNTFRHELYTEYKAHRAEAPMDLIPQFSLIRQAGLAYGMPMIEAQNYEADDVIATLAGMAQREGLDVHILSGDKDLMQLIRDDGPTIVHMIDPMKMERVTSTQVMEKWNVTPDQLGDVLALAGDAADNVPGVPGIGPKIAADLLREFGSLEYLLDHLEEVQQKARRSKLEANVEQARLSKALVTLVCDLPVEVMTFPEGHDKVRALRMEPMNEKRILSFYDEMGFRDLKQRFTARLEGVKRTRRPAAAAPNPSRWSKMGSKVQVPHPDDFRDVPF